MIRIRAELFDELEPIHLGHVPINQNERDRLLVPLEHGKRLPAIGGLADLEAHLSQGLRQDHADRLGIVDYHRLRHCYPLPNVPNGWWPESPAGADLRSPAITAIRK